MSRADGPGRRRGRRLTLTLGLLAIGLVPTAWLALSQTRPGVPRLPIPAPNGYADLVAAARSIGGVPPTAGNQFARVVRPIGGPEPIKLGPPAATWDEARAFVDANAGALARARVGLDRESVVPVADEPGHLFATGPDRNALLRLGSVFLWEARLASREGRPRDAARSFLDMVRFGHSASRGGLPTHFWAANNTATGGLLGLHRIRGDLDAAACREAILALEKLDRDREPYRSFLARERAYQVAEQGAWRTMAWDLANARRKELEDARLTGTYDGAIAHARLIRVELALRAFESENGHLPDDLGALVPSTLPGLPLDPFSGRPPAYRKTEAGPVLSSPGPDRLDGGGQSAIASRPVDDIRPDSPGSTLAP